MTTPPTATTAERGAVLRSIREEVDRYLDAHPELLDRYVELGHTGAGATAAAVEPAGTPTDGSPLSEAEAEAVVRRILEQAVAGLLAAQPGLVDEMGPDDMAEAAAVAVDRAFAPFEG